MAEYPSHLIRQRQLSDRRSVTIQPIRTDDVATDKQFFDRLSGDARRRRFTQFVGALNDGLIHFYTPIDYDRHMAFVCEAQADGKKEIVGEARYVANPDGRSCQLGIVVADDWRHTGTAQLLIDALIRAAHAHGFETMEGLVLSDNRDMLDFVRALGFQIVPMPEAPGKMRVVRKL